MVKSGMLEILADEGSQMMSELVKSRMLVILADEWSQIFSSKSSHKI